MRFGLYFQLDERRGSGHAEKGRADGRVDGVSIWVDAVEKVGGTPLARNNRIIGADFLNQSCAFDARLESMLLRDPSKSFFNSIGQTQK